MYNVQRNAHLIDSFIILSYIYRSYIFQGQRVILRDLSLGSLYIKKGKAVPLQARSAQRVPGS